MSFFGIIITYVFISNFIFTQFLGLCPFIGVSKDVASATGMGFAVIFVMSVASVVTWGVQQALIAYNLQYLQIITFILVIASLVQLVEMIIQKISPPLYKALGIYLPLITTNCAVLGIAIIAAQNSYSLPESFVAGFAAGVGFLLAIFLMANLRVKLESERIPQILRGAPVTFISAGLMAMAFMAFDRALLSNLNLLD